MEFSKKESAVGEWAKKGRGQDIENGGTIKLTDGGRVIQGQFGDQNVFSVETKNGVKNISLNQTSINAIVSEYGTESKGWIGKTLHVHAIKQNVQGKFTDVYYFVPQGYEMGEYGFEKEGAQKGYDDIPTIQQDDDIDPESVPF